MLVQVLLKIFDNSFYLFILLLFFIFLNKKQNYAGKERSFLLIIRMIKKHKIQPLKSHLLLIFSPLSHFY